MWDPRICAEVAYLGIPNITPPKLGSESLTTANKPLLFLVGSIPAELTVSGFKTYA